MLILICWGGGCAAAAAALATDDDDDDDGGVGSYEQQLTHMIRCRSQRWKGYVDDDCDYGGGGRNSGFCSLYRIVGDGQ